MTVRQPIEEEYQDALQNIEAAIISLFRRTPSLTDSEVEEALSALIRQYQAEWRGRAARPSKLSTSLARDVFDIVQYLCDWLLGRTSLYLENDHRMPYPGNPLSLEEIATVLKRIRKSVRFWSKKAGRQGYLRYVDQFLP